ncbi:MAG TPA: hypothetical protein VHL54_08335 [Actinomycetota bacterium]|nr:hypothetical protein [Actinomycetota bacterium]
MQDPALVIVNGLLKSADEAGLKATQRYEKDAHYQATLWKTADVAVAALGIEQVDAPGAEHPVFRLRGVEAGPETDPA